MHSACIRRFAFSVFAIGCALYPFSSQSQSIGLPDEYEYYECKDNYSVETACTLPDDVFFKYVKSKISTDRWQYYKFKKDFGWRYQLYINEMAGSGVVFSFWWDSKSNSYRGNCGNNSNMNGTNFGSTLSASNNSTYFDAEKDGYTYVMLCAATNFSKVTFSIRKKEL